MKDVMSGLVSEGESWLHVERQRKQPGTIARR